MFVTIHCMVGKKMHLTVCLSYPRNAFTLCQAYRVNHRSTKVVANKNLHIDSLEVFNFFLEILHVLRSKVHHFFFVTSVMFQRKILECSILQLFEKYAPKSLQNIPYVPQCIFWSNRSEH